MGSLPLRQKSFLRVFSVYGKCFPIPKAGHFCSSLLACMTAWISFLICLANLVRLMRCPSRSSFRKAFRKQDSGCSWFSVIHMRSMQQMFMIIKKQTIKVFSNQSLLRCSNMRVAKLPPKIISAFDHHTAKLKFPTKNVFSVLSL